MANHRRSPKEWREVRVEVLNSMASRGGKWMLEKQTTARRGDGACLKVLATSESRPGRWWHGFRYDEWEQLRPLGMIVINERAAGGRDVFGLPAEFVAKYAPRMSEKKGTTERKFEILYSGLEFELLANGERVSVSEFRDSLTFSDSEAGNFSETEFAVGGSTVGHPPAQLRYATVGSGKAASLTLAEPTADAYNATARVEAKENPQIPDFFVRWDGAALVPDKPIQAAAGTLFRVRHANLADVFDWVLENCLIEDGPGDLADRHDYYGKYPRR